MTGEHESRRRHVKPEARQILMLTVIMLCCVGPTLGQAQPDGFSAPLGCCSLAAGTLPVFPDIANVIGSYASILNCTAAPETVDVAMGAPTQIYCDKYLVVVTVTQRFSSTILLSGTLVLTYSRTFMYNRLEQTNPQSQVWRFDVNGDFVYEEVVGGLGVPVCQGSSPAFPAVHFTGTLDYERLIDEASHMVFWSGRMDLTHFPDEIHHNPTFSSRPGLFHPCTLYALVTPGGPGEFNWTPTVFPVAPSGIFDHEAVREDRWDTTTHLFTCLVDSPLLVDYPMILAANCLGCGTVSTPRWTDQSIDQAASFAACPPRIATLIPILSTFGAQKGYGMYYLGQYTTPVQKYPGTANQWADFGMALYDKSGVCPFPIDLISSAHILVGSTTQFLATSVDIVGGPVDMRIMGDVSNLIMVIPFGSTDQPIWGVVGLSDLHVMRSRRW